MNFKSINKFAIFLLLAHRLYAGIDTVYLELAVSGLQTLPIGVVPFQKGGGDWGALQELPEVILQRDLYLSGRFAPEVFARPDSAGMAKARIAYYVTGRIQQRPDGRYTIECRLLAAQSGELITGNTYTVDALSYRQAIHDFSDRITWQLYGARGIARTRLAWVAKIDGFKQIVVADYDGFNRVQATKHASINTMPTWGRDNNSLYFVSFRNGPSQIFVRDLSKGTVRSLFSGTGQAFSPDASPVNDQILLALSQDGSSDIFRGDLNTGKIQRLTFHWAVETSPAWSPNGHEILFTSDRTGRPQLYVMGSDGSDLRRLTHLSSYTDHAAWSPTGDRIAYTAMDGGRFNIYTCSVDGRDIMQLTVNAGDNERPTWSPDGMLIAFSSTRTGQPNIFLMRKDGSGVTRITHSGENTLPTWSYFDKQVEPNPGAKP